MPRAADGEFNVWNEGARANLSTACLAAFQAAVAKHKTRSDVTIIPTNFISGVSVPGYLVASNWMGSLGTAADAYPGGKTDWRGRVVLQAGPLILPAGHSVIGVSPPPRNDAAMYGSELWAASGYTGTGTRLLQLGADNYTTNFPDSTRVERMLINGRDIASITGVYANAVQEECGVFDCSIRGVHHGIVWEAGANVSPANAKIERNHVLMNSLAAPGDGIRVYGIALALDKNSVVRTASSDGVSTFNGDTGFVLRGSNIILRGGHFEGFDYGCDIGGPDTGVGNDVGFWTFNITVDGLTGYNTASQTALLAAVRIRNDDTHVFNVDIRNVSLNQYNSAVYLVQDDVNGIVIPASSTSLTLQYYRFGGIYSTSSGSAVKRPVFTSYYDWLCAPNAAVMAAAVTGTTADLASTFAAGGEAGILQITSTSTPILQGLASPRAGRTVYGHNLSGSTLVLDHNNGGTAANRFHCSTGADINIAVGSYFRATYGDARGAASWSGAAADDRWYVEAV